VSSTDHKAPCATTLSTQHPTLVQATHLWAQPKPLNTTALTPCPGNVLSPTQYSPGMLVVLNGMLSMPSGRLQAGGGGCSLASQSQVGNNQATLHPRAVHTTHTHTHLLGMGP
jgi:hypothetical protein